VLDYLPYYGGYGTQGLQSSDLGIGQNAAQCAIPFQGTSCCSDDWCQTRYYLVGKVPYIELQEGCVSTPANGGTPTCIYDPNPNNVNASLTEVLALATQHNTNVIELGAPEFQCAFVSSVCTAGPQSGVATAIMGAAAGQPSSTGSIFGGSTTLGGISIF
jgi:hypothetical protein